jgi:hypothetical protein
MYALRLGKKFNQGNMAFAVVIRIRTSSMMWHFRLGHHSSDFVTRVVRDNKLHVSIPDFNRSIICVSF